MTIYHDGQNHKPFFVDPSEASQFILFRALNDIMRMLPPEEIDHLNEAISADMYEDSVRGRMQYLADHGFISGDRNAAILVDGHEPSDSSSHDDADHSEYGILWGLLTLQQKHEFDRLIREGIYPQDDIHALQHFYAHCQPRPPSGGQMASAGELPVSPLPTRSSAAPAPRDSESVQPRPASNRPITHHITVPIRKPWRFNAADLN